jgi:DNA-binding transcriptional ArsR family regulator
MCGTHCADDGSLDADLAGPLDANLQDALDHPLRREILRSLNGKERPRSVAEIGAELSSRSLSEVNYHVQVLQRSGVVVSEGACLGPGDRHRAYRSAVAESTQALSVLRATQPWDRQRMRTLAEGRSSNLLTMFRVPRPTRTLRLGRHGRGSGER